MIKIFRESWISLLSVPLKSFSYYASYYCILIPINIKISAVQNLMKSSSYKFNKEFFPHSENVYNERKNIYKIFYP